MRLQILHVPDCPNTAVMAARLDGLIAGRGDVTVEHRVVRDADEAVAVGMAGSPTLLIDGVDPFAADRSVVSLSCRLYVDETGAATGAPTVAQLRAVLAGERVATPARVGLTLARWRAAGTGSRQAALPAALRELHQGVLRHFLDDAGAPDRAFLERRARPLGLQPDTAIGDLAAADLMHLDDAGRVCVAYPFSGVPSGHRVRLAGGSGVWAMCAIDALGIPQLADRDATITAADPSTGEPVRVDVRAGTWRWLPTSTVVLIAQSGTSGPSAQCTCGHVSFYTRPEQAGSYLDAHPELNGQVLDQRSAIELAGGVFGALLR